MTLPDKHPGDYEVKLLRLGNLCRSLKFTVGADGKIVDPGIGAANHLGSPWILFPTQPIGDRDGAYDKEAYKTAAFYGNPLTGFTP